MKTRYLIVPSLIWSMSGCTTVVSPQQAANLDMAKTGLVLATVSPSGVRPDRYYADVEFDFRRVGGHEAGPRDLGISSTRKFWLIEVPPGRYQISNWHLERSSQLVVTAARPFAFDVRAGEITYLGDFDVARVRKENPYGGRGYPRTGPVLEDHYEDAVAAFRKSYPTLGAAPVRDAAPRRFVWEPVAAKWIGVQVVNGESATTAQDEWGHPRGGDLRAAPRP